MGARDRHRPVHVREHDARGPPDGRRADRRPGVEPHKVYRQLYEDLPFRRLQLLQRALASVERYDDGAMTVAHLTKGDYEETGALGDRLRGRRGPHARGRGHARGGARARAARRRSRGDAQGVAAGDRRAVDVSRIARSFGGGGHPQAAGFSTTDPVSTSWSTSCARRCASSSRSAERPMDGVLLRAKPAGVTSHDVVARGASLAAAQRRRSGTPAPSTRSRPGCCSCSSAARRERSGSSWSCRRPTGRWPGSAGPRRPATATASSSRPAGCPSRSRSRSASSCRRPPAYSAVKVGGRARLRAGARAARPPS